MFNLLKLAQKYDNKKYYKLADILDSSTNDLDQTIEKIKNILSLSKKWSEKQVDLILEIATLMIIGHIPMHKLSIDPIQNIMINAERYAQEMTMIQTMDNDYDDDMDRYDAEDFIRKNNEEF